MTALRSYQRSLYVQWKVVNTETDNGHSAENIPLLTFLEEGLEPY